MFIHMLNIPIYQDGNLIPFIFYLFVYFFFLEARSFVVSPGWPQTQYIAKDNFEILISCLFLLSSEILGMCHCTLAPK